MTIDCCVPWRHSLWGRGWSQGWWHIGEGRWGQRCWQTARTRPVRKRLERLLWRPHHVSDGWGPATVKGKSINTPLTNRPREAHQLLVLHAVRRGRNLMIISPNLKQNFRNVDLNSNVQIMTRIIRSTYLIDLVGQDINHLVLRSYSRKGNDNTVY